MKKLPPLDRDGSVTAGNAPGVNDGAAAVVLASSAYAQQHGLEPLATGVDQAAASLDPAYLALTPAMAAQNLLERHGLAPEQIAVWEVNEAFAAVAWSTANLLGIDPKAINALGGAVAFGHPIGAFGRAGHGVGRPPTAAARRWPRHRDDLFRRRSGRRDPDPRRVKPCAY